VSDRGSDLGGAAAGIMLLLRAREVAGRRERPAPLRRPESTPRLCCAARVQRKGAAGEARGSELETRRPLPAVSRRALNGLKSEA